MNKNSNNMGNSSKNRNSSNNSNSKVDFFFLSVVQLLGSFAIEEAMRRCGGVPAGVCCPLCT